MLTYAQVCSALAALLRTKIAQLSLILGFRECVFLLSVFSLISVFVKLVSQLWSETRLADGSLNALAVEAVVCAR